MGSSASKQRRSFESRLIGDAHATGCTPFGYTWLVRSFGIGALRVRCTSQGIESIDVWARPSSHERYLSKFYLATEANHWFVLTDDEFLTAIDVGVDQDSVCSMHFETNSRQSQWFGSKAETVYRLTAPRGFYVQSIHGHCHDGVCKNFGAFYVSLALRSVPPTKCAFVAHSDTLGSTSYSNTSPESFYWPTGTVRAIVVSVAERVTRVVMLSDTVYTRYLAHLDGPICDGDHLVVLARDERVISLFTWVDKDSSIMALQFVTSRRTTELFGPIPPRGAILRVESILHQPKATHIGGIFGMEVAGQCIKTIGVSYYRHLW